MALSFDYCESIYWVFTHLCNDSCAHCYNLSSPRGGKLDWEECGQIIQNLPDRVGRIILSGGEPLVEKEKLVFIVKELQKKYKGKSQVMLQTNGDLLSGPVLDELIESGISRFDIASMDSYHKLKGSRLEEIASLFEERNIPCDTDGLVIQEENLPTTFSLSWGYWGATDDLWLGGNWARGRALESGVWKKDPNHNFCAIKSGAIGFLNGAPGIAQEISIQLWKIHPCCPGTKFPLGDARKEKVEDVLDRVKDHAVFQSLDQGNPFSMGETVGVKKAYAEKRCGELKSVCLWCDEFFEHHFDVNTLTPRK